MAAWFDVVLQGEYFNQNCISRFTYMTSSSVGTVNLSTALALAFIAPQTAAGPLSPDGVLYHLRRIMSTSFNYTQLTVGNLRDPADFYQTPLAPMTGALAGEPLTPAVATGFRSSITRRDIGRAYKRFAGVTESVVAPGGVWNIGHHDALRAVANKLGATLTYDDEGAPIVFTPCVIKRQRYDPDTGEASNTGRAYRIPTTEEWLAANTATGITWEWYPNIRTQRSRQYGYGE